MKDSHLAVMRNTSGITFRFQDGPEKKSIEQRAAADIPAQSEDTPIPADEDLCPAEAEWEIMGGPEVIRSEKIS